MPNRLLETGLSSELSRNYSLIGKQTLCDIFEGIRPSSCGSVYKLFHAAGAVIKTCLPVTMTVHTLGTDSR